MPASPPLLQVTAPSDPAYLRLAPCPDCAGRRRVLAEVAGELSGRCLDCGVELSVPLDTERHHRRLVVGRAGQAVVEILPPSDP
jgi:hypothetical protein